MNQTPGAGSVRAASFSSGVAMEERDRHERGKSPLPADEQDSPEPERPVPPEEDRRSDGQEGKPSQAEGERDTADG